MSKLDLLKENEDNEIKKFIEIMNFEIEKTIIQLKGNQKISKYLCYCKDLIVKHYLYSAKIILNEVTLEIYRAYKTNFEYEVNFDEILRQHLSNVFKYLYRLINLSEKIIYLFEKTQTVIDKLFCDYLKGIYQKIKEEKNIFYLTSDYTKSMIISWIENSIFNLLSIGIPCEYIQPKDKKINKFCFNDIIKCDIHYNIMNVNPFVYFVVQPELLDSNYFINYLNVLKNNIDTNILKKLIIFIDYQFISNYELSERSIKRYSTIIDKIKFIYIFNVDNIIISDEFKKEILSKSNIKVINNNIPDLIDFLKKEQINEK